MSTIDELRQDVAALQKEIQELEARAPREEKAVTSQPAPGSPSFQLAPSKFEHQLFNQEIALHFRDAINASPTKHKNAKNNLETPQGKVFLENCYRLIGITVFPLENNDNQLGVRLDVYNEYEKDFESPHYIILQKDTKSDRYLLFKYTVPKYIDIIAIFESFGFITSLKEVYLFAREIYVMLLRQSMRRQFFLSWSKSNEGTLSSLTMDANCSSVAFTYSGINVQLTLSDSNIDSVRVTPTSEFAKLWETALIGPYNEIDIKISNLRRSSQDSDNP